MFQQGLVIQKVVLSGAREDSLGVTVVGQSHVYHLIHPSLSKCSRRDSDVNGSWMSFLSAHQLPHGDRKRLCSLADPVDQGACKDPTGHRDVKARDLNRDRNRDRNQEGLQEALLRPVSVGEPCWKNSMARITPPLNFLFPLRALPGRRARTWLATAALAGLQSFLRVPLITPH